jgi:hypothetical protein
MKRHAGIAVTLMGLFLLACMTATHAQGVVIESVEDLKQAADAPQFRGVLPARADLSGKMPLPGNQSVTGSCTGWSTTYAAASEAYRRLFPASNVTLSPAFTYNQLAKDSLCQTATNISKALDLLRDVGGLPLEEFVFDPGWCGRMPTQEQLQRASRFRIKGWSKFDPKQIVNVKAQVSRGAPVIFSTLESKPFHEFKGDGVFGDLTKGEGHHAMVVIGYDDSRNAVRIQNSWGRQWGDGGRAWVSYEFFQRYVEGAAFVIN